MVLALIIIIRIISILGLFVNSSVVGSVNTNLKKITLYSMRTQKEMVSVPVFYCLQIKKKKSSYSLAYLCTPAFKLKMWRHFPCKSSLQTIWTYAFLQQRLDHILCICLFLPLAALFSSEGLQVPLSALHVLPEDSKHVGRLEKKIKNKNQIIAENIFQK